MSSTAPESGPDEALAARLRRIPTSTARVILQERGVGRVVMQGIRALVPVSGSAAGPARTLRFLPSREDLPKSPRGAVNRRLIDSIGAGEVLVIDAGGHLESAVLGDMLATRAQVRGAAAVVADGVMRDVAGIQAVGLPVFARGTHPAPNSFTLVPWDLDTAVQCGGVLVQPGDWVLGDTDAVIVIPPTLAEYVAERGEAIAREEEFSQRLLLNGFPLDEAYPLPAARRAELEQYLRDGTVPTYQA